MDNDLPLIEEVPDVKRTRQERRRRERLVRKLTRKTDIFKKQFDRGEINKDDLLHRWNALMK